jgi:hypothetical protein
LIFDQDKGAIGGADGNRPRERKPLDSISRNIGRIGENLVANFLLAHGFHVTHLDKGVRGVSPNADLFVWHDKPTLLGGKAKHRLFVQVKTADARGKLGGKSQLFSWVRLGNPEEGQPFFNRKKGLKADIVAYVAWRSTSEQRLFFAPVAEAEKMAKLRLDRIMATPRKRGKGPRKLPPKVMLEITLGMHPDRTDEIEHLLEFEDGKAFNWNTWQ